MFVIIYRFIVSLHAILYSLFGVIHLLNCFIRRSYPANIWIPNSLNILLPFWLMLTYFTVAYWIGVVALMGYDIISNGLLLHMSMQLEIIKYRLRIISINEKKQIRNCVKNHLTIYTFVN